MPSPFPGMDPYLEEPRWWPGFHSLLIGEITGLLNRDLPPEFAANAEERVIVGPPERLYISDINVSNVPQENGEISARGSGIALLERTGQPTGIVIVAPSEERELYVNVRSMRDDAAIICTIEVLSPANKMPGHAGRAEYQRKQQQILQSDTHLLEIDLLRGGTATVAVLEEALVGYGRWDHLVCLHRSTRPDAFAFWLNALPEPLPLVQVPLTPEYDDVLLDLQTAFTSAFDKGPYRRRLRYEASPIPPLANDEAAWADQLLRERALR